MAEPPARVPAGSNEIRAAARRAGEEARALLPGLAADIEVELELDPASRLLVPDEGIGGQAVARDRIRLAFDPTFAGDRSDQLARLRGAVFHELFHLAHGAAAEQVESRLPSALEDAVYEGAATVFERERAGTDPRWGETFDAPTMLAWAAELAALPNDYDRQRWKFWDAENKRAWVVYRVGTFIVDRALSLHPGLSIEDLASLSPREIVTLADLKTLIR